MMNKEPSGVREKLADYAHDAWAGWMTYLFEKSTFNDDGSVTIPKWAVDRWKRQAYTLRRGLPESEKESAFTEADKMLDIMMNQSDIAHDRMTTTEGGEDVNCIVELEDGVWLAPWSGNPGIALVLNNACVYCNKSSGTRAAKKVQKQCNRYPNAKVISVALVKLKKENQET